MNWNHFLTPKPLNPKIKKGESGDERKNKTYIAKPDESFEPEIFELEIITDFDSFDDRLREVQDDCDAVCAVFHKANANKRTIMDEAAKVEKAAKALIRRLLNVFRNCQ